MSNEFIEPELDNWLAEQGRRKSIMDRPILLFLVLLLSLGLLSVIYPKAALYFEKVNDCGDITTRPEVEAKKRIELTHDRFCQMTGIVSDLRVFSSGDDEQRKPSSDAPFPAQDEFDGVRYFTKLAGDKVFVVLDAAADDVYAHRKRHRGDGLFGFEIDHVGRVIDPASEGGKYQRIAAFLRAHFGLRQADNMRLLDTTDSPEAHLIHVIAFSLSGLGTLLSAFGLVRLWRRRMA